MLDATDVAALLALGERRFDAALSHMALFDMAESDPLLGAPARLLETGGRFVFSVLHPCLNNSRALQMAEMEDRAGQIVTTYAVKVYGYMTPTVSQGAAIVGQPKPQLYFHRSLQMLLGSCFTAGFMLDGLEERAFRPEHPGEPAPFLGWPLQRDPAGARGTGTPAHRVAWWVGRGVMACDSTIARKHVA